MSVTPSPTEKGLPTMPRTISSPSIPLYISILTNGLEENLIGLLTMLTIPVRADHGRCLHSKLTELPALHTLGLNVSRILTMYIQHYRYFEGLFDYILLKCGFRKKSFIMNVPLVSWALLGWAYLFGWVQQQTHPKVMTDILSWLEVHS